MITEAKLIRSACSSSNNEMLAEILTYLVQQGKQILWDEKAEHQSKLWMTVLFALRGHDSSTAKVLDIMLPDILSQTGKWKADVGQEVGDFICDALSQYRWGHKPVNTDTALLILKRLSSEHFVFSTEKTRKKLLSGLFSHRLVSKEVLDELMRLDENLFKKDLTEESPVVSCIVEDFHLDAVINSNIDLNSNVRIYPEKANEMGLDVRKSDGKHGYPLSYVLTMRPSSQENLRSKILSLTSDEGEKQKLIEEAYWKELKRSSYGAPKVLRSVSKWETFKDADGVTPMMWICAYNPENISLFKDTKKVRKELELDARDNQGRNFWFYVALNGKKASTSTLYWLKGLNLFPCMDKKGNGLLYQLVLHNGAESFSKMGRSYQTDWLFGGDFKWPLTPSDTRCDWFWGKPKTQSLLAEWLSDKMYFSFEQRNSTLPRTVCEVFKNTDVDGIKNMDKGLLQVVLAVLVFRNEITQEILDKIEESKVGVDMSLEALKEKFKKNEHLERFIAGYNDQVKNSLNRALIDALDRNVLLDISLHPTGVAHKKMRL